MGGVSEGNRQQVEQEEDGETGVRVEELNGTSTSSSSSSSGDTSSANERIAIQLNDLSQIYDHNRNLNVLHESFGDHLMKEESSLVLNLNDDRENEIASPKQDTNRGEILTDRQPTVSPVCSLAASDGGSGSVAGAASGCSSTKTNSTSCSTQRISQNSLLIETNGDQFVHIQQCESAQIDLSDNQLNLENRGHFIHLDNASQGANKFTNQELELHRATGDGFASTEFMNQADNELEHQSSIMIQMLGNEIDHADPICIESAYTNDEEASLVKHLGRRISVIPRLLAKRGINKTGCLNGGQKNQGRCQMPVAYLPPTPPEQQPTTVAGVGGTITTVTRDTRKTAPLPRLVAKNGTVNLFLDNIDRRQFVRDLFTTMIDIKWRYNLLAAALGFVFSWLFFACIWYLVLYVHNDLVHENDPNWSPCIVNVNSFPAALLFSIETQSTLGFGSRIISVECPGAIVIFCIQLIFGVVVECLIVGMVFAKLSRPAKRSQTIMYSKYATICLREGQMCLTFRVGDVRSKSHIIGATIRASLVSQKITEEGETIPFYHHQLDVKIDDSRNSLLLIWPVTIVHLIDESSPFFQLNAESLANFKFEIITVLEGTVESTGQSIQVRSSYLPSEVKWGYRFEPIVSTHGYGRYAQTIIDYNKFNQIIQVDTPTCSAKEYYSLKSV